MSEWICESCVHYPPSTFGSKPCAICNPQSDIFNCYESRDSYEDIETENQNKRKEL